MSIFHKIFGRKGGQSPNKAKPEEPKLKYDFTSIDAIRAIPIPKYTPLGGISSPIDNIEYILQRQATEHKRSGRMDLAIECLKKSNEIFPHSNFTWQKKDYARLVSFLKQDGRFDEARSEQAKIDAKFGSDSLPREAKTGIQAQSRSGGTDLVHVSAQVSCCCECAKYRNRVYTLSGKDNRYPAYPKFLIDNPGHCNLVESVFYHGISAMWDENHATVDSIKCSNRPFVDDRTVEEKRHYEAALHKKQNDIVNRKDYDLLREFLPELAPKSYSGYVRMKNSNSANYQKLYKAAQASGVQLGLADGAGINR